jgi:autotransporter family porin
MKTNISSIKTVIPILLFFGIALIFSFGVSTVTAANSSNIYVSTHGNDSWNGQSATYINGTTGPKLTINSATMTVSTNGTIYIANGTYNEHNIIIINNMKIIGESSQKTIINAQEKGSIFFIVSRVNITIENLILANGTSTTGGAIYNMGNLNVKDSIFTHNKVTSNNITAGGAIYNTGNLTISKSSFTDNIATSKNKYSLGGAIYNYGNLTIENKNSFTNNTASYGGAIFNSHNTSIMFLNISNSTFTSNNANNGGAIWNEGNLVINNSSFTGNVANERDNNAMGGGAISNEGTLTITESNFKNNKGYIGGAISNYKGTSKAPIRISSSTFTSNTAMDGGAIYNYGALAVTNDIFNYNTANTTNKSLSYDGGAIFNGGNLTVTGSTFTSNIANWGGALFNRGNSTISSSTLKNNRATYDSGAIFNNKGTLTVHFNRIIGNQIVGYGSEDISNYNGKLNAEYNWWGSNSGPSKGRIKYETNTSIVNAHVNSWMVLTITASSTTIKAGGISTITTNLLYDSKGVYHNHKSGHVPDGITVSFTTPTGTVNSCSAMVNGTAQSILKGGSKATVINVLAKTDSQSVQLPLKVTSNNPKNGAKSVSRTASIAIKFSQNVKSSINWSKVYIKNLTTGKMVSISKSISGNTLYIKMTLKRNAYNWYQVYIPASAVKDYYGKNLTTGYTFKFKTGKY